MRVAVPPPGDGVEPGAGRFHRASVDPTRLEDAIERVAGRFPMESRVEDLIAASPIVLRRDDVWREAASWHSH
jgi:hypothetical protein